MNTTKPLIDHIYALYHIEDGKTVYFYVGRSEAPKRRLREHRYGAKTYRDGDEQKYLYANCLDKMGVKWDMEILHTCDQEIDYVEDFFVNKLRLEGHALTNMRAGDSEPWMGRNYATVEDFLSTKKELEERLKIPRVKRVREGTGIFIDDLPGFLKQESHGLLEIRARLQTTGRRY